MTTLYLVRHGEVEGNVGAHRTFAGRRDLPLTPRGELQAQAVALRLASKTLDAVYASTLQRAWKTADAIASSHGLGTTRREELREVDYGDWEGLGERELFDHHLEHWEKRVADPWSVAPPNGESYGMLWARLEPFWTELLQKHDGGQIAVVAHNGPIRILICRLLEAPMSNARALQISNASLTKVHVGHSASSRAGKLSGPPVVIEYLNNTTHLEEIAPA